MNRLLLLNGVIYSIVGLMAKVNDMPNIMLVSAAIVVLFTATYVILDK